MKLISVIALLAPAALAAKQAPGDAWITLIKEQCSNMPERCIDIAKKVHQPGFNPFDASRVAITIPGCNPTFAECAKQLGGSDSDASSPGASQGNIVTCLLQVAPDHIKYFLDNDRASVPIPSAQNCELRELHRVAHVELGPLA